MEADVAAKAAWRWLLWVVAVASTAIASWLSVLIVAFADGPTCDGVATSTNRDHALLGLLVALLILSGPWVAFLLSAKGHRFRLVLGWMLGVSLLLGFGGTHLTVQSWSGVGGGFCF